MKKKRRMCLLFSIIECVYRCSRVTWLSMFVNGSSYVNFSRPSVLCIHFIVYFESEMSDFLLGALSRCPFHHYVHCWCDFTPCLIWVDHYSSLCYLFHHHPQFRFWFIIFTSRLILFLQQPISGLILSSFHHYTYHTISSFCFICPLIDIIFTLVILRSMAHKIYYTCCISYIRAWFSDHWVFEPSFPSFLSPYHPGLCYVTCLKTTLKP